MHRDLTEMGCELSRAIKEVRLGTPKVMKSFSAMAKAATEGGALDEPQLRDALWAAEPPSLQTFK